jgi:hypothetical protein
MKPTAALSRREIGLLRAPRTLNQRHLLSRAPALKTHVYKPSSLPPASPALFTQRVVLADGSSFTIPTTSPRSVFKLTRDLSNHPTWFPNRETSRDLRDEDGRIGRFVNLYRKSGGTGQTEEEIDVLGGGIEDWMSEGVEEEIRPTLGKKKAVKGKRK